MADDHITCRHYSDLSFGRCSMGIRYSVVAAAGESDDDSLFSCFMHHSVSERCEHAEFPFPREEPASKTWLFAIVP
jgi:hypothetical protein